VANLVPGENGSGSLKQRFNASRQPPRMLPEEGMNAVTSRSAASDDVETRCPDSLGCRETGKSSLVELRIQRRVGSSLAFQRLMMRVLAPAT